MSYINNKVRSRRVFSVDKIFFSAQRGRKLDNFGENKGAHPEQISLIKFCETCQSDFQINFTARCFLNLRHSLPYLKRERLQATIFIAHLRRKNMALECEKYLIKILKRFIFRILPLRALIHFLRRFYAFRIHLNL